MRVSIILPYWDRQEAANKALALLDKQYAYIEMEVIVVDDGNRVPFVVPKSRLDIRVVTLPRKNKPTPQSKAWNAGVKAARGEIIVLSCIEVLHEMNVLEPMVGELFRMGEMGYVLAAAWCPEMRGWQCHSSLKIDNLPEGTGPAFCGMLYRKTFDLVGGFDESYHEGAGYEDKDFVQRLVKAGVQFKIRDDLIVTHPKTGASITWPAEGFARNQALYHQKWGGAPVTVLCLKAGNGYGPEYVNILFDMVRRNLKAGYPGRFVCLTDDPTGLDDGIETLPLPKDLETWWGKLYMFKRGLFQDGERVIFMDLDTLIVGDLEPLMKYEGEFATLRDFYFPQQVGPAIISWKAGPLSASIWEEWDAQGRPRAAGGDLWWINSLDQGNFAHRIDKLQDLLPGYFCSFKADCHPYPPKGVKVVCFHGQPKPDNCATPWVEQVWKIGGSGMADLNAICNVEAAKLESNIRENCGRAIPWLDLIHEHQGQAVIVGGGPSLQRTLPEIQWRKSIGQTIIAVNGSAKFLNAHGIKPDIHVVIDARAENAEFLKAPSDQQFVASHCAAETFDAANNPTLFHMNISGIEKIIPEDRVAHLISSGTTVGLAAMAIAYTQGYRALHLHGFDSSYSVEDAAGDLADKSGKRPVLPKRVHHAYHQPQNNADPSVQVSVEGARFFAAPWMVKQVQQFQELAVQLAEAGVVITVAGDGLLPFVAMKMGEACH